MIARGKTPFEIRSWASPLIQCDENGKLGCTDPSGLYTASMFHNVGSQLC